MDNATRSEAAAWLAKTHCDPDSARRLFDGTPPYRDTAAYHCQPAAEKALKAFLAAAERRFQRPTTSVYSSSLPLGRSPGFADQHKEIVSRRQSKADTPPGTLDPT